MSGYNVLKFNVVPSTMDLAKTYAAQGYPEWTVILAMEQTGGRGRYGRSWFSPRGGLWFSVILRPKFEVYYVSLIGFATAVAVVEAIRDLTQVEAFLKWPNDVLVNDKKVAGILVEATLLADKIEFVVVGVGVNTNISLEEAPKDLRDRICSLKEITGREVQNGEMMKTILSKLSSLYPHIPERAHVIVNKWKKYSSTIGSLIRAKVRGREIYGRAIDIDPLGRLLIKTGEGAVIRVDVGEVIHLREIS